MFNITKGYKEGRSVMYYDIADMISKEVKTKVDKDTLVKMCEEGLIKNTKIQWWEGKAIVRCADTFEIVKLDKNGTVSGKVVPVKRVSKTAEKERQTEKAIRAEVVAKIGRKKKESIAYGGYDRQLELDQLRLQNSSNYTKFETVGDLFMAIAAEYRLRHTEDYLKQFAKKVNPDKKVKSMAQNTMLSIQDSINTYLMNMAYKEINETSLKFRVK